MRSADAVRAAAPGEADARVSVVVLTHNRCAELLRTLQRLLALPERPAVIVVDNASADDSARAVQAQFPQVRVLRLPRNLGAAGRNAGVARVRTPYVAFCDDDTWWEPGALSRAADLLEAHPRIAALNARVLVGADDRPDPTCDAMARSPLPREGLPGPALIGFMAGAVVMRCEAFREAGGYEPRLFLGAEEALLGLDLVERGWHLVYAADVVTHHHASPARDARARRRLLGRNRLWIGWLRLPWASALHETRNVLRELPGHGLRAGCLADALRGLPWVLRHRRPIGPHTHALRRSVYGGPPCAPGAPRGALRRSR